MTGNSGAYLTAEGSLNNQSGTLAANGQIAVRADQIINQNGRILTQDNLNLTTQEFIDNTDGKILSDKNLQALTQSIRGKGEMTAGQDLALTLTGDWINQGTLLANNNLPIASSGNLTNTATMVGNRVTLKADNIANQGSSAVIYAGKEANLLAGKSLENKDEATIYSSGNINIAGSETKDENGQYASRTETVFNQSANIEAEGNIRIAAKELTNKKREFAVAQQVISQTNHSQGAALPNPSHFWSGKVEVTYESGTLNYTQTITDTLITKDSPDAVIAAGNNMSLRAETITNDQGQILAAGELDVKADTLTNTALARTQITTQEGATIYSKRMKISRRVRHDKIWYESEHIPYYQQTLEELPAYAAIFGGGQVVNIQVGNLNNVTINSGGQVGNVATTVPSGQVAGQNGNGPDYSFNIPAGGLYKVHREPEAKYLVETDPRFTNFQTFMSSDYMLARLTSDPERVHKRLGDGFYEQKLVREQITQLTGRLYLDNYSSNEEQFKALMDSGLAYAEKFDLRVGVALTPEQIAQLTSNIVWMVEKEVDGQKVLVPVVYLAKNNNFDLKPSGAVISANQLSIEVKETIANSGQLKGGQSTTLTAGQVINRGGLVSSNGLTQVMASQDILNQSGLISGNQVVLEAQGDIRNETLTSQVNRGNLSTTMLGQIAKIQAQENLVINAGHNISNQGAQMKAGQDLSVKAGGNLEIGTVEHQEQKSSNISTKYQSAAVTNVQSSIDAGGDVNLITSGDAILRGAKVNAGEEINLAAQGKVTIEAVKDRALEEKENRGRKYYVHTKEDHETVRGSELTAQGKINMDTKDNLLIAGSYLGSEEGKVSLKADQDITIKEETERHESLVEGWSKKSGFLSSTTTAERKQTIDNLAVGSIISGETLDLNSGNNLTVRGSQAVASNDINLEAENNLDITTAQETSIADQYFYQKKSGLSFSLGGGGIVVFVGSTSQQRDIGEEGINQAASTIGSLAGKVNIGAGKDANVTGSEITGKAGIEITAQNVNLDGALNTGNIKESYEFQQKGLGISLGNKAINALGSATENIEHANDVQDQRLKALLEYRAARKIEEAGKEIKAGNLDKNIQVSIGITNTQQKSETLTAVSTIQGSQLISEGQVKITATGNPEQTTGNIQVTASQIKGKDIDLEAAKDINLQSGQNISTSNTTSSGKSSGIGVTLAGGTTSLYVNANKSQGQENAANVIQTETLVIAQDSLKIKSGQDTNLIGAQAKGNQVQVEVGGNLNLESLQDIDNYNSKNKTAGFSFSGSSGNLSANKGTIDSDYRSVQEQTGIYAGQAGFQINVEGNTDLKGAVIASKADADKNKLVTNTLTFSDIQNKAEYNSDSKGISLGIDEKGKLTPKPEVGIPAEGEAESTTKSAISPADIQVKDKENSSDLSKLSTSPEEACQALEKIFDKKTVQEKQELAKVFGEEAFKLVGDIAERKIDEQIRRLGEATSKEEIEKITEEIKNWAPGGVYTVALHTMVGGLMASLGGGDTVSGAIGAGVSEASRKALANLPENLQRLGNALVGAVVTEITGGNGETGAGTALSGIENNHYGQGHSGEKKANSLLVTLLKSLNDMSQVVDIATAAMGIKVDHYLELIGLTPGMGKAGAIAVLTAEKVPEQVAKKFVNYLERSGLLKGAGNASTTKYVNLASEGRTKHILFGDATGGGHIWPGAPSKTPFPKGWSGDKIMNEVSDIVTDPNLKWVENRVVKGVQRYEVIGIRDGVKIKVVTDDKDIITAFPVK